MMICSEVLEEKFREHADSKKAEAMEAYMRNQFMFLGIRTPERNLLLREFWKQHPMPKGEELLQTAEQLWQLPEREFHYIAMILLEKYSKHAEPSHIDVLERWLTTQPWWDTVDLIAS